MNDDRMLDEYLAELHRLPVISGDERASLLGRAREGDAEARRRYIEALLLQAATLATRECPPGMRTLDAIQEANVVLVGLLDDNSADPAEVLDDAVRRHLTAVASRGE